MRSKIKRPPFFEQKVCFWQEEHASTNLCLQCDQDIFQRTFKKLVKIHVTIRDLRVNLDVMRGQMNERKMIRRKTKKSFWPTFETDEMSTSADLNTDESWVKNRLYNSHQEQSWSHTCLTLVWVFQEAYPLVLFQNICVYLPRKKICL